MKGTTRVHSQQVRQSFFFLKSSRATIVDGHAPLGSAPKDQIDGASQNNGYTDCSLVESNANPSNFSLISCLSSLFGMKAEGKNNAVTTLSVSTPSTAFDTRSAARTTRTCRKRQVAKEKKDLHKRKQRFTRGKKKGKRKSERNERQQDRRSSPPLLTSLFVCFLVTVSFTVFSLPSPFHKLLHIMWTPCAECPCPQRQKSRSRTQQIDGGHAEGTKRSPFHSSGCGCVQS